jgi:hypothetical protein
MGPPRSAFAASPPVALLADRRSRIRGSCLAGPAIAASGVFHMHWDC